MKFLLAPLLLLIRFWQRFISPGLAPRCKYYPSCSSYAYDAIKHYQLLGLALSLWRLIRCNPFSHGGVDHLPNEISLGPIHIRGRDLELV